jgi:hypothetical protein
VNDKELRFRAREAVIKTGNFTEEQIARIRKGQFKPKALEIATAALTGLSERYVDPTLDNVRKAMAEVNPRHSKAILAGHWDNHMQMRIAKQAYFAGLENANA